MALGIAPGFAELLIMALVGGGGFPLGVPPQDPDPLARVCAPEKVVAYVSWAGSKAPDANSTNRTEQMLAEPEIQALFEGVEKALIKAFRSSIRPGDAEGQAAAQHLPELLKTWLTHPTTIYLEELSPPGPNNPPVIRGAMLVRVGDKANQVEASLLALQQSFVRGGGRGPQVTPKDFSGSRGYRIELGPPERGAPVLEWCVKRSYLLVGVGEKSLEQMIERCRNQKEPTWLAAARTKLPVKRVSNVVHVDVKQAIGLVAMLGSRAEARFDRVRDEIERSRPARERPAFPGGEGESGGAAEPAPRDRVPIRVRDKGPGLPRAIPGDRPSGANLNTARREFFVAQLEGDADSPFGAPRPNADLPPQMRQMLETLGLANVKSLTIVSGLDDDGFVTQSLLSVDGKLGGILSIFDGKPLTKADLAPIPHDSTIALALKLDAAKAHDAIMEIIGSLAPQRAQERMRAGREEMEQALGFKIREDLLASLGDTWRVYNSPSEGGLVVTGLTAVVDVRDRDKLVAVNDKLVAFMRQMLKKEAEQRMRRDRDFDRGGRDFGNGIEEGPRGERPARSEPDPFGGKKDENPFGPRGGGDSDAGKGDAANPFGPRPTPGPTPKPAPKPAPKVDPNNPFGAAHRRTRLHFVQVDGEGPFGGEAEHDDHGDREQGPARPQSEIRELKFGGHTIYYMRYDMPIPLAPAWCITDKELIVALFPQNIKAYLSRGADYKSIAEQPQVAALFEGDTAPLGLAYWDSETLFEYVYPLVQIGAKMLHSQMEREGMEIDFALLPSGPSIARHLKPGVAAFMRTEDGLVGKSKHTIPGSGGLLLAPAAVFYMAFDAKEVEVHELGARVSRAMRPADMQSINRLKNFGVAMANYEANMGRYPSQAPNPGKPVAGGLSWRVHLLPYLEQANLYNQFKLDEPWDSPHNKKLIAKMPRFYASLRGEKMPAGHTPFMAVVGKDSLIAPGGMGTRPADIRDGTSNTLAIVEARGHSVIWTKPDDLPTDDADLKGNLFGSEREVFGVFGDGSVQRIAASIDAKTLANLINRHDGNVIDMRAVSGRGRAADERPRLPNAAPSRQPPRDGNGEIVEEEVEKEPADIDLKIEGAPRVKEIELPKVRDVPKPAPQPAPF